MVSFLFLHQVSYKHIIILTAIALVTSTSIFLVHLQGRTDILEFALNITSPDPGPPIIYESPVNPFDISFDGILYRDLGISQVKIEESSSYDGNQRIRPPLDGKKRLRKRDIIPVTWEQMRNFIGQIVPGPVDDFLFPGISGLLGFLAELETYKTQINYIEQISEYLDAWRWREAEIKINPLALGQNLEANGFYDALRSYAEAIEDYPDFMELMESLVGTVAAIGAFGRYTEPNIMMRLIFMDTEQTAQELDDEWFVFLATFLEESAAQLRDWIAGVEFAMGTYAPIIFDLKSDIVSDEDFERLQTDVEHIAKRFSELADIAVEASIHLWQFRHAVDVHDWNGQNVVLETPGTLPYTPGLGVPAWYDSPEEGAGDVFYLMDNEPLTPPSNSQGDDYIDYLRTAPWASNQHSRATEENVIPNSESIEDVE
ncbi:hypothetical protein TWF730_005940 [Orbilia blumenaviensis]|uniref:Uncharacterized protein n=1 Tax=Orbilia blumenaviensis TaxID=1796055 RepID=A0AAV9VKZ6_9PEZI